jgi:hypothetical protein
MRQPVIAFTAAEAALHEQQARERSASKRTVGARNSRVDTTRTDYVTDLIGIRAEHAASILFGVPYHTCAHPQGDGGVGDLVVEGRSVQVKSSHYVDGKLVFLAEQPSKRLRADIAVLFTPDGEGGTSLACRGYLPRGEFYARCTHGTLRAGGDLCDWVVQADLRPITELLDLVELNRQGARLYRLLRDLGGLEEVRCRTG